MGKASKDKRDIYYRLAKEQGWRARSAFKLLQIQETFDIFKDVKKVVDLCAAPGSWCQVLSREIYEPAPNKNEIKIIAVDLQTMNPIDGVVHFKGDITSKDTSDHIIELAGDQQVDLVICDGAPDVTGLHDVDEFIQHDLVISALDISTRILRGDGTMISKVFRGKRTSYLVAILKLFFGDLTMAKPRCSRDSSLEAFIVCRNFKLPEEFPLHNSLRTFISAEVPPFGSPALGVLNLSIPFKACGSSQYDADRSYPLTLDGQLYQYCPPVQPPIHPPYEKAQQMRKDGTLART